MRAKIFLATIMAGLVSISVTAQEMGIVTGAETGTYIQIGYNISELVKSKNVKLNVYPSPGSVQNIQDVYKRRGVQLGIVQSDVLGFINISTNSELRDIAKKVKLVFPLYNEEIHVFGNSSIRSLADLGGKRIGIGLKGSGTNLTAGLLLLLADVKPAAQLEVSDAASLDALKRGELDAFIAVGGTPMALFDRVDLDQGGKYHLIDITEAPVFNLYKKKEITPDTYKWMKTNAQTATVLSVLMTYDYPESTASYMKQSCQSVGNISRIIHDNIGWLRENGHPKWKEVNLDAPVKNWEQSLCVQQALRGGATSKSQLADPSSPVSADKLISALKGSMPKQ